MHDVWPDVMWQDEEADEFRIDPADGIRAALDAAGYVHSPATLAELKICFLEYVDAGYWHNLTHDDAAAEIESGEITTQDMINALRR